MTLKQTRESDQALKRMFLKEWREQTGGAVFAKVEVLTGEEQVQEWNSTFPDRPRTLPLTPGVLVRAERRVGEDYRLNLSRLIDPRSVYGTGDPEWVLKETVAQMLHEFRRAEDAHTPKEIPA